MDVLFDQGVPAPLRQHLPACRVTTAFERGWQTLANGELLAAAETAGFQVLVTTDGNLRYQQNLSGRSIAILVLSTTDWRRIKCHTSIVSDALTALDAGAYVELSIPQA